MAITDEEKDDVVMPPTDDEVIDPGAAEGTQTKIDPRTTEPPTDSPRFHKIYGQMKQFERDLATMKADGEKKDAIIGEMRNWNQTLADALENSTSAIAGVTTAVTDTGASEMDIAVRELDTLNTDYKEALEKVDYKKAAELNDKIIDIKLHIKDLANKPKGKPTSEEGKISVADNRTYKDFIDKTEWYKTDVEMRGYAIMLDQQMALDPVWGIKPLQERLTEIKGMVEKRFSYKAPDTNTNKGSRRHRDGGVDTSHQTGRTAIDPNSAINTIEAELVRGLGLSNDQWMAQKAVVARARGGK